MTYQKIAKLKPYKNNAKRHPKEQVERIAESIRQFGFTQPVLVDKNNVVIAGHGRILGAKKIGMTEVPVIYLEDLTDEQVKAYRLIDNKLNESDWDLVLLENELKEIVNIDMPLFGFTPITEEQKEFYTTKVNVPQYEIKGEKPELSELCDLGKTRELLERIKASNVPEEVKHFLKLASYRHIVFDYTKIAEYYAQADKETQELMEDSALVIIDFNDAIAKGYVELSREIALLCGEESDEA